MIACLDDDNRHQSVLVFRPWDAEGASVQLTRPPTRSRLMIIAEAVCDLRAQIIHKVNCILLTDSSTQHHSV
jgi:hypothetical protein